MNDITSLNRISSLSAYLHDEFVGCGEIPDAEHVARLISECEPDFLSQLTDEEILVAVHNATDSTCESYIENANDSTEWTQEGRDDETEKWEALRPKRIREKQISETLRAVVTEQKPAPAKEINRTQVYNDADAAMTALRNSMTALLNLQDGLFDAGREETADEVSLMIDSVCSAACRLESLANTAGNIYL
jgi:hypothetical protein